MAAPAPPEAPSQLLGVTIRRSIVLGRAFLIYGVGISLLLAILLNAVHGVAFEAAFPLFLPIFASVGAMGGLTVFTSDRLKGVLEYLLAYGISPRRLFVNTLVSSLVLVTVIVGVSTGVGVGLYLSRGNAFGVDFGLLLGLYALPMCYASVAFTTTVGMFWTSLSSPRQGLSSPVGLAPLIGILPPVAVLSIVAALGVSGSSAASTFLSVALYAIGLMVIFVVLLLGLMGRLLLRERLLSPA